MEPKNSGDLCLGDTLALKTGIAKVIKINHTTGLVHTSCGTVISYREAVNKKVKQRTETW
jgi:hypothetical protein